MREWKQSEITKEVENFVLEKFGTYPSIELVPEIIEFVNGDRYYEETNVTIQFSVKKMDNRK